MRGGARVKSLLRASTISGWVLVIFAPVYAVFFVVALILVEQLITTAVFSHLPLQISEASWRQDRSLRTTSARWPRSNGRCAPTGDRVG